MNDDFMRVGRCDNFMFGDSRVNHDGGGGDGGRATGSDGVTLTHAVDGVDEKASKVLL